MFAPTSTADIEIHFCEIDGSSEMRWEENGIFTEADVHHQVAIAFKTPKYRHHSGGIVHMKLYRPSDEQCSEPLLFEYIPEIDVLRDSKKRKLDSYESVDSGIGQASTSSGYGSSSPDSPMEDNSSSMESSMQGASRNYQTLSGNDSPVDREVVAATSNIIGSPLQDVSRNYSPFSENDSPVDAEVEQLLFENYSDLDYRWPNLTVTDIINNLKNGESSKVSMDAADHIDLYPENAFQEEADGIMEFSDHEYTMLPPEPTLQGEITGDMECNARKHPILCQSTLTSGRDETNVGKILAGIGYLGSLIPSRKEPIERPCSGGLGIGSLVLYGLERGMENVVSYFKPSYDSKTDKAIPRGGQEAAVTKCSFKPSDEEIVAKEGLCFDMTQLSIEDGHKKEFQRNVSMESPIAVSLQSSTADTNARSSENISYKNTIEINHNFEHFKEGISCIMKNREKGVYLQYISKLMSVTDEDRNTFLHLAVREHNENVNLIAKILKMCPDFVNKRNNLKETPLHLASKMNAFKVVFLLLSEGGNSSIMDGKGNNCFHITSEFNFTKSMKCLLLHTLKSGKLFPSIDDVNYEGWAPVHLAVLNNSKECLKLLLHAGADINIKDRKSGSSPLNLALKLQPSLIQDLLSYPHIDLLIEDFYGDTFVDALCNMKGVQMPMIDPSIDLIYWARKTYTLPSVDALEVSSESSETDLSDEESDNEQMSSATASREYSALAPPHIINDVDQHFLNEECEERLRTYLDADSRWRKLGLSMGYDEKILDGWETLSKNSSPSKVIFKKIKNCDKPTLINLLTVADLKEAINILK